jgi:hypothetical protein
MSTRLFDTNELSVGKNDNSKFLNSNDFKSSLVFPSDLADENFFPEAIKFSIYDREGVDFDTVVKDTSNAYKASAEIAKQNEIEQLIITDNERSQREAGLNISAELLKVTNDNIANANNRLKQADDPLVSGVVAAADSIARQKTQPKSPTERHIQSIYLQMPPTVSFSEGVEWQGSDLGIIGGALKGEGFEAMKSGGVSSMGELLGGAAGGLASKLFGGGGLIGATLGSLAGGGSLQGGLESTFNVKSNPYKEQTFQGVGFRPFEFQFVLRSRNQTESFVIRDIVNAFRAYSKPSFKTAGESGTFAYPKEFRIEFLTVNGGEYKTNKFIPQIKYCICTSVATNFTGGGGWRSFEEGAPTDVQLSLSFQETEIITQEDVFGKTKVGRFKNEEGYF